MEKERGSLMQKRILFVITEDWAIVTHRFHLVEAAIASGYKVGILTRISKHRAKLLNIGADVYDWELVRGSTNFKLEAQSIFSLWSIINNFQPDLVHAVAFKPVIYSGILLFCKRQVAFIGALGGLGFVFNSTKFKAMVLRIILSKLLFIIFLKNKSGLILQNEDDKKKIINLSKIDDLKIKLVLGAGIETAKFAPTPIPLGRPNVILPARFLYDKGIFEFARVAKSIKKKGYEANFVLVGSFDKHNPNMIKESQLTSLLEEGYIEDWGWHEQMADVFSRARVVCLPSYHEGLPKVLLEAASCARPIVAFDIAGCREIVIDNLNGRLIKFGDETLLEKAILEFIIDKNKSQIFGEKGRKLIEEKFSSDKINRQTISIWVEVLNK
jgi:glycosyltransferase involved in cell wall biosynthesis